MTQGDDGMVEELEVRPATSEEIFYHELSWKEPVEGIARIEEVAKFMVGAVATTSGLFLAAFKLSVGSGTVSALAWYVPFICWAFSILSQLVVLLPRVYPAGMNEPASWKRELLRARRWKYRWLCGGASFFVFGILAGVYPFACS